MKRLKVDNDKKTGNFLMEFSVLFMILNFLCAAGIWQSILNHWQVMSVDKNFLQAFIQSTGGYKITYLNQQSLYLSILSFLFSFLGNKEGVVMIANLVLQLFGVLFFYLGIRKITNNIFSIVIAFVSGICSGIFFPVVTDTSMHLLWFLVSLVYWISVKIISDQPQKRGIKIAWYCLLEFLLGSMLYLDFAGGFLIIVSVVCVCQTNEKQIKDSISFFIWIAFWFIFWFKIWNGYSLAKAAWMQWFQDRCRFVSIPEFWKQYFAMAVVFGCILIFSLICYYKAKKEKISEDMFFDELDEIDIADIYTKKKEETVTDRNRQREEKAVIAINNSNSLPTDTANEEKQENTVTNVQEEEQKTIITEKNEELQKPKIKYIENPLPLPKKHVKKEMTYAFEPSAEQMHYDLNNYNVDDDYDLKSNV